MPPLKIYNTIDPIQLFIKIINYYYYLIIILQIKSNGRPHTNIHALKATATRD